MEVVFYEKKLRHANFLRRITWFLHLLKITKHIHTLKIGSGKQEGGGGKIFMKLVKGLIIQNRMHLELLEFESLHCYVNTK